MKFKITITFDAENKEEAEHIIADMVSEIDYADKKYEVSELKEEFN